MFKNKNLEHEIATPRGQPIRKRFTSLKERYSSFCCALFIHPKGNLARGWISLYDESAFASGEKRACKKGRAMAECISIFYF